MAEIIAGIGTSHVPAIGAAIDHGSTDDDYWAPLFAGYAAARQWIANAKPDVLIVAYNDHASAFSLELIPTFTLGVAPTFAPADEGYGPRQVPIVEGDPDLAWYLAEHLILDEFDMTIANAMAVDHGLTVPLSILFDQPNAWPCRVVPLCVNVIQYPPPTGRRCFDLGRAIARIVATYPGAERIAILGTGGMSHQLQGERAGLINAAFDTAFLDRLSDDAEALAEIPHVDYLREAGTEGIELVMWLIMRGALGGRVREIHRHYHVAASNTGAGLIIFEPN